MTIFAKNKAFNEKLREGKTKRVNFSLDTAAYESSQPKWKNYEKVKPFLEKESQEFIEEEFKEQDNTFPGIEGQVSGLAEELTPGPLRDELLGGYDSSQETYEEWLQRINLGDRPFNMNEGGLIGGGTIAGTDLGSRTGFSNPKNKKRVASEAGYITKRVSKEPYIFELV